MDYEQGGLYLGTWAADVGDGLEIDLYGGYGIETDSGFSASVGFTGYYYTGDFDDTYEEINLGVGYGMVSLGYSVGEWDGFEEPADYSFLEATVETEVVFTPHLAVLVKTSMVTTLSLGMVRPSRYRFGCRFHLF